MTNPDLIERLRECTALKYAGDCKCGRCQLVSRDDLLEAIAALESRPAGVAVRKLEWRELPLGGLVAHTAFGQFSISVEDVPNWPYVLHNRIIGPSSHKTVEEAKAAAQADFDQRIRSALTPSPEIEAPPVGEAEAVGCPRCNGAGCHQGHPYWEITECPDCSGTGVAPASLAAVLREAGFTSDDYQAALSPILSGHEPIVKAGLSNNYNVIIAALRVAAAAAEGWKNDRT